MPTLDTSNYAQVFVLDSQLALEAKPLSSWDWSLAGVTGPVLLLVLPQMLAEVDGKKRDGRLGERARAFNRLLEPCTTSIEPLRLQHSPVVDIVLCANRRIDWSLLQDLDPDQGDDRLVAEALNALVDDPSRLCVLSYDTRPRAAAIRHALTSMKPDENWMLAPEPSPAEKEISRLRQRVQEMAATQPAFVVTIRDAEPFPAKLLKVQPISEETQSFVSRFWLEKHPRYLAQLVDFDFDYDRRYDDFEAWIKAFPSKVHRALQTVYGQRRLVLRIENTGHVAAEHLEIWVRTSGGKLRKRLHLKGVIPPKAPRRNPNARIMHSFPQVFPSSAFRSRVDVDVDEDTDASTAVRLSCDDFRQRRIWEGELFLELDVDVPSPTRVTVEVTATNASGMTEAILDLPFEVQPAKTEDLIDFTDMTLKRTVPHFEWMKALPKEGFDERVDWGKTKF